MAETRCAAWPAYHSKVWRAAADSHRLMPRNSANTDTASQRKKTLPGRATATSATMLMPHSTAPNGLVARAA
ncbi:MAG: hypothetical protein A2045_03725 [Rhodocyclales bacterium GWA2_65_20]|nr:MAG: hypothetical protein A2045_03725 [Rhodocyclales bacterium GWA2_65_20]